jgi:predicted Zn-dependent protease
LNRLSGGDDGTQRIPTFLSTHPDPGDRSVKVQAMALDYQAKNPGNFLTNRDGYLRLIDGIIYGEDPKQGYVENNIFYHPELKFQFPIPTGWKYINSPAQFQMASPDQKALMILTLAPEKTLTEAANNFVTKNKLKPVNQQNTQINGLPAIVQVADQVAEQQQQGQQAQTVRIATTYIEYNGMIYMIHGVSDANDFRTYDNTFGNTMKNFRVLTDPSKINVKPERVKIQTTYSDATLGELLKGYGTPEKRLKELSILNGMELTQRVARGTLIKTIVK